MTEWPFIGDKDEKLMPLTPQVDIFLEELIEGAVDIARITSIVAFVQCIDWHKTYGIVNLSKSSRFFQICMNVYECVCYVVLSMIKRRIVS